MKKIKVGVIGSIETIDRIKDVLMEFEDKIEAFTYCYQHKSQTIDLLAQCQEQVDVLLFSGQVPYSIAKEQDKIRKPVVFIPRTGTSVYRAFWQMKDNHMDYSRVSFDTIPKEAIEEAIKDLGISMEKFYVKSYPGDIDYKELTGYHYDLWQQGEIYVAATCLSATYRSLKDLGVPVVRLYPTRPLIREYINKALYKGNVEKIKATQMAVQIVKMKNHSLGASSEYEFLKRKNRLEEGLIEYTQANFGSIFPFGRDEYMIFTTRGAIDGCGEAFTIPHFIKSESVLDIGVASGIGFGDTVHEAEDHARIAVDYAMKEENNCCFIVDEKGVLCGPIYEENSDPLSYDLAVSDNDIQRIAKQIQTSPTYVMKLRAIINKIGRNRMEAEELANYLGISVRSARRILKQVVDAGLGSVVANEQRSGTGRPRQIYEIQL